METHKTYYPQDFSMQAKTHRKIGIKPLSIRQNNTRHPNQSNILNYSTYFQRIILSHIVLLQNSGYAIPTVEDISIYLQNSQNELSNSVQVDIELCNILNIDGLIIGELILPRFIETGIKNKLYKYAHYLKGDLSFAFSIYLIDIKQDRILWKRTIQDQLPPHHSIPFIGKALKQECEALLSAAYLQRQSV